VIGGDRTVVAAKRKKSEGFRNFLTLHKECVREEREREMGREFLLGSFLAPSRAMTCSRNTSVSYLHVPYIYGN
jgi:hypothetical protein